MYSMKRSKSEEEPNARRDVRTLLQSRPLIKFLDPFAINDIRLAFIVSIVIVGDDSNFKSCMVLEEAMRSDIYSLHSQNEFIVSFDGLVAMYTETYIQIL